MKRKYLIFLLALSLALLMNASVVLAADNPIGDLLNSVNELVGSQEISSGSAVTATLPNGDQLGASAIYNNKQTGLNALIGGLLGGSYSTSAELSGPDNLSAKASTNGDYGLASSVKGLGAGLGGLLSGLLSQ
ncbi:MAG TPA: hypothetical protein VN370_00045 [Desulfitobacteriaceae bacterium]|jgi:hypothetical protein|nr:hypothetical protein [Desulfitobacteriaceae bacterium]